MKTHYLVGFAALALAFAGCSKNEILETEGSKTGNAISFSTYAKGSKGTAILDNAGLAKAGGNFGVTAFLSTGGDEPYMGAANEGAKIIYTTAWGYEVAADARYWPKDATNLVFYGYTPFAKTNRGVDPTFTKAGGMVFTNYVVPTDVANQEDFMWAYTSTNKATSGANGVQMTFHHALVRVNFKARVTTSTLKVDIQKDGITICNIKKKGKVTITSATTFADWTTPKDADTKLLNEVIVPSETEKTITYDATPDAAATAVSSTTAGDAVMLMPQTFAAWAPKTPGNEGVIATTTNGYLKVMCKIYNTSTTPAIYYHGTSTNYAAIYIPLSSTNNAATNPAQIWVANNNITYTLNFGGGYDENGNPILTPITFTTAVTDWNPVTGPISMP